MPFPTTTTKQRVLMMNGPLSNFTDYINKLEAVAVVAQAIVETPDADIKALREALASAASESSVARNKIDATNMKEIKLSRDDDRDLKFIGEQIAFAKTSPNNASPSYSGSTGHWTEYTLYRTASGKYVCASMGGTQWQGENPSYSAKVCETHEQIIEFFGTTDLAKELYHEAKIEATQVVG